MRKSRIIITVLSVGIFLILGSCSKNQSAQKEGTQRNFFSEPQYKWDSDKGETLTVWGAYPDLERSYIAEAFKRYKELTGNDLELVQMPKEEYTRKMQAAFEGEGEQPDIILSYGGTSIEFCHPDDNFYDFSGAQWVDDLTDTSINQTIYNGKVIGLPHWEASVSGTLYNKRIFAEYGLEVPRTQEEFMEVCESLKEHDIIPLYLPGKDRSMLLYQFPLDTLLESNDILNGLNDGSMGYPEVPGMVQMITWYKEMREKGYFGEDYLTNDWAGMSKALDSGRYAMMLCWDTWLYTDFKGNPDEFGLMPAFMGVPSAGTFEGPNLGLLIVNKHTEKLEDALNFITFVADPYNYNAAFEDVYTAPVFKNQVASISTPQYLEAERLIDKNFRDSTAWLRIRGFSQMDSECILEYMDSDSQETAEDCLKKMEELRQKRLKDSAFE